MAKEPRPREGKPPPKCKAILLCERIILDAYTGQVTLFGIVDELLFDEFPESTDSFRLFLLLVDGIGSYEIWFEVHDLQEGQILATINDIGTIEFDERPGRKSLNFKVPPLSLEHPGLYDVVVFADDQEIDRIQFTAVTIEENEDGEQGSF